ncbi:uncharacterized protein PGTG_19569, partial [Puccinia graminis f. sp. tritici CRL 75-36-700-3]
MSDTRRDPVVCHCQRCNQQRFRQKDGNWAPGAIVSSATKISHAAADTQMAARFGISRDSDNDSNDDSDDDMDSDNDMKDVRPDSAQKSHRSESPCSSPILSDIYNCDQFYNFTLKDVNPAVLHISLSSAMLSVFDHVSVATSSWLLKSGKDLLTLAVSGGLGDRQNDEGLNVLQQNTLNSLPSDIRTVLARLEIEPTLVTV